VGEGGEEDDEEEAWFIEEVATPSPDCVLPFEVEIGFDG